MKPMLSGNGKQDGEDIILDVTGLVDYLKVSKQWLYVRTHLKEITHMKIDLIEIHPCQLTRPEFRSYRMEVGPGTGELRAKCKKMGEWCER